MNVITFKLVSIVFVFCISFISSTIPMLIASAAKFRLNKNRNDNDDDDEDVLYSLKDKNRNNTVIKMDGSDEDGSIRPLKLNETRNIHVSKRRGLKFNYKILSTYITCFSGGIFLATSMLDLLADSVRNLIQMQGYLTNTNVTSTMSKPSVIDFKYRLSRFPLGEFFIVIGILMIMVLEQVMLTIKEAKYKQTSLNQSKIKYKKFNDEDLQDQQQQKQQNEDNLEDSLLLIENLNYVESQYAVQQHQQNESHSPFVLLVSICLHSIFEGLSIGLQVEYRVLINIITAISVHKCLMAFSLSQQLLHNSHTNKYCRLILYNTIFSISNPIGIFIGIFLVNLNTTLLSAFLISFIKAISCGTFIYITFFEILPHELNNRIGSRLKKIALIIFGFFILAFIMFFMC